MQFFLGYFLPLIGRLNLLHQPLQTLLSQRGRQHWKQRSPWVLAVVLAVWSLLLGTGLAWAAEPEVGTVDPVPEQYEFGQQLYLENCATCHIGVPPSVLPDATWRQLLLTPERHFGVQLEPLYEPSITLVWYYLRDFSRPLLPSESIPYGIDESRYFKALHPRVEFSQPVRVGTCINCHPGVADFNFRSLTPEWDDAS